MSMQYIGARYVPKFFEGENFSNDWMPGLMYEALTIVSYNRVQWISKIPVPSSVGAPNENPQYWVQTSQVQDIVDNLQSQIDGLTAADKLIQQSVTDLDAKLTGEIETVSGVANGASTLANQNKSGLADLTQRVTTAEGGITTNGQGITDLGRRMTTTEGNVSTLTTELGAVQTKLNSPIEVVDLEINTDIDCAVTAKSFYYNPKNNEVTFFFVLNNVTKAFNILTNIFTVPVKYRPSSQRIVPCISKNTDGVPFFHLGTVETNGNILQRISSTNPLNQIFMFGTYFI